MTQSTSAVMIKRRPRLWKIVMDTLKPASGCHVNLILTRHFILVTGHLLETMMMSALLWSQPVLWELKRNHQTTVILQPDNVWLVIMWRMKCVISISNIVSMKKMKKMLKIILMMSVLQLFKWYYTLLIDRLIFIFDFQECLTGSSLTSASCYDYLQHYVNEKVCFQENHQESHQHEEDHQYSYNQNNHNFNNNDYWNNFMNNLHNGISFFA